MSTIDNVVNRRPPEPFIGTRDRDGGKGEIGRDQGSPADIVASSRRRWIGWSVVVVLLLAASATIYFGRDKEVKRLSSMGLVLNNSYIHGLYTNKNAKKTTAVFQYVFQHLEDEVTVYPSEGYYYFNLAMRGKTLSGSIHLDVLTRDTGTVSFGFVEKFEDRSRSRGNYRSGWGRAFGPQDGLEVRKINDFRYALTFEGRTVKFNLYNGDTVGPVKARLMGDEVYVGPSFDESGLRFFLIFNKTINKLYWVLNEDGFVPEDFTTVSDHLVMGDRTEFVFYLDSANNRKILVGVQELNVGHNNWFDGPFDQLPDNHVKTGRYEVRNYLEAHFGYQPGKLDPYGNYLDRPGARASVSSYAGYFDTDELSFVDSALAAGLSGARLYQEITRERIALRDEAGQAYQRTP